MNKKQPTNILVLHRIISNMEQHIIKEHIQNVETMPDRTVIVLCNGERIPVTESELEIRKELGD
jgi:uncharacterized protein YlzI (FlbEa/FlbD family)